MPTRSGTTGSRASRSCRTSWPRSSRPRICSSPNAARTFLAPTAIGRSAARTVVGFSAIRPRGAPGSSGPTTRNASRRAPCAAAMRPRTGWRSSSGGARSGSSCGDRYPSAAVAQNELLELPEPEARREVGLAIGQADACVERLVGRGRPGEEGGALFGEHLLHLAIDACPLALVVGANALVDQLVDTLVGEAHEVEARRLFGGRNGPRMPRRVVRVEVSHEPDEDRVVGI